MNLFYYLCILCFVVIQQAQSAGMIEVFKWKQMDYYNRGEHYTNSLKDRVFFPGQLPTIIRNRRDAITERVTSRDSSPDIETRNSLFYINSNSNSSSYIPYNNVPMGATHFQGRLFITMPRRRTGIPSTLNYINLRKDGKQRNPKLYAYPNFEVNQLMPNFQPNPEHLISVYRTSVDSCKRLWFIDTGMLEYPNNRTQVQRPSIWVIDLLTDHVVRRFQIPKSIVETGRGLASIAIDVKQNQCNQAFAYIPDLLYNRLYVYSFENNRIWAFSHNYFKFDPLAGDLSIGGQTFRWDDGIFSITLGPIESNGYRKVYFHAMASNTEFFVSSQVLQTERNAARSDHGNDFQVLGSRGVNRQSTMHHYDPRTHTIFYNEIQRNGVGCWNTKKPFSPDNHGTVVENAQLMIYPSDLTIDEEGTIWVMTNSMPIFIYSNLDPNVVNFRVWKQNVFAAIKDTVCE